MRGRMVEVEGKTAAAADFWWQEKLEKDAAVHRDIMTSPT